MSEERTKPIARPPLPLACLMSGGGRTVLNLQKAIAEGRLNADIRLVIASRPHSPDAPGVDRVRAAGLPVKIADRATFPVEDTLHDAITAWLRESGAELICLCGYLRWFRADPPHDQPLRVINIHPSLLPKFGGKGMHGLHVHRAVLAAGETTSGCTVHAVDAHYDNGPIILQRTCPVLPSDTPETLAARVFEQECIAYPQAVQLIADGRVRLENGRITITD